MLKEKDLKMERTGGGQLCEGHVALRHMSRFKTKASSAPVPGLLSVQ